MAKKKNPTAEWLVRPLDSHTNQAIARDLERVGFLEEVETELGDMYICSYERIAFFQKSARDLSLKFEVYRRRNRGNKPERWKFDTNKSKSKKSKKFRQAQKDLDSLKK